MKGMKKLLCVLLAGAMIMGLCACGKTGSGKSGKDDDDDDRGRRSERTEDDDEDDDDDDDRHGRDRNSDDDEEETNGTEGRKYYEEGGYDGEECFYLVDNMTPEEIVELYAYYRDTVDELGLDCKDKLRDYLLVEPEDYYIDSTGDLFISYSPVLDDPIDYVDNIYISENAFKRVECNIEINFYDFDRVKAVMEAFKDYYAVDGAEAEDYDCAGYYEGGYEIELGGFHNVSIGYQTHEFDGTTYYSIQILESK